MKLRNGAVMMIYSFDQVLVGRFNFRVVKMTYKDGVKTVEQIVGCTICRHGSSLTVLNRSKTTVCKVEDRKEQL